MTSARALRCTIASRRTLTCLPSTSSALACSAAKIRGDISTTHRVPSGSPSDVNSATPAKNRIAGSLVTSGLLAKRASISASLTKNISVWRIACAQKATSRGVSPIFRCSDARNHWCRSSNSVTRPIGVPQIAAASCTSSSHSSSGWESSKSRVQSALKLAASASVRRTFIIHRICQNLE